MPTKSLATFSIIIPTFERPHQLRRCLEALTHLDYPKENFEVIVVNDGSTLPLDEVVEPFQRLLDLQLVHTRHGGPAAARNAGARHAKHEYFAFTDDDCAPAPPWLQIFAKAFCELGKNREHYLLGGYVCNLLAQNVYSTASQLLVDYLYEYYGNRSGRFFTSNNFALSSSAFWKLGGFDETFPPAGEDRDFCRRAADCGMVLQFVPEAEVGHFHALTFRKFQRQHFSYGKGAFHYHVKRWKTATDSHSSTSPSFFGLPRPEPISFYTNLLRYPWRVRRLQKYSALRAARLSLLLLLSQIFNAAGFFRRFFSGAL